MKPLIFSCENTGEIAEIELTQAPSPFVPAQFCIVYRYECLYESALPRFDRLPARIGDLPYGLPSRSKRMRVYNGIDREPLSNTPDDFHQYSEKEAAEYLNSLSNRDDLEIIFIRMNGCVDKVPDNMTLLGFDAAYPFGFGYGDGFSAMCDCMFLARWHGCDPEGTEFLPEYNKLNANGLFDSAEDAYAYMVHYLNQDWTERGEFCIYEIYG